MDAPEGSVADPFLTDTADRLGSGSCRENRPPRIIQGGMGVGISGWRLAAAVSATGQLGVVSGTALETMCARRLQGGDPGGHVRRALAAFPVQAVAEWIIAAYFVDGGVPEGQMFRAVPRYTLAPPPRVQELTVAANFVEVYLAKHGAGPGGGPVGVNYLRKIEFPLPAACYGAMLAGVDYVLMGAGNPAVLPGLVRRLARHQDVSLGVRVQGASSADGPYEVRFSPAGLPGQVARTPLPVPRVLAIVASVDLARSLAADPDTRPDGFVVEGPSAGGHNAPPRGPRRTDAIGQPVYDARDEFDPARIIDLGLPTWLAGSYATPERLRAAVELGAAGIQVGTAFALCEESGFAPDIKRRVLDDVAANRIQVRSDWRCSPTGFPFRVVELPGTLSDPAVAAARQPVCDLGILRSAYLTPEGKVGYRCPAEPAAAYVGRKGGREANLQGRVCLCNALLASAGLPQRRRNGDPEPPLVTAGSDFTTVAHLLSYLPGHRATYPAADVIAHLLTGIDPEPGPVGAVIGVHATSPA
jgi:NAD(P)H-dependent flavin oxidoreductase YrpB (nitropropane dioxygenase family)